MFARSALTKGSEVCLCKLRRETFVLISKEVQFGTGVVQGVCRPSESLRVASPSQ
jgi:hypothetical protein